MNVSPRLLLGARLRLCILRRLLYGSGKQGILPCRPIFCFPIFNCRYSVVHIQLSVKGRLLPGGPENLYWTLLTSLKIGVMTEIAIKPTTTPKKMINKGSIIDVRPFTVASTSLS